MLFRPSLATLFGRPILYPFLAIIGNWPVPAAVLSRQYLYKIDRMVGVTDNLVLARSIYPAYRYAR